MESEKSSHIRAMLLWLTSLSFLTFSMADFCPQPEDVYPCKCVVRLPITLKCGGPDTSMSHVRRAIESMVKNAHIFQLKFKNLNIGKFDVNILNGSMAHEVFIEDCTIEGFIDTGVKEGNIPRNPTMINTLDIHNSIHGNIEINLSPFENVQHLSLSNNVIKNLEMDWSDNIMGPMTINMANNSIESVDQDAFAQLSALQILDMSMNQLRNLGQELRPTDAKQLFRVDFSHNHISSISRYYFRNMPALKYVSLSHNQIQVLTERIWKHPWVQIDYVNFEENPLNCGKEIKWIQGRQPESVRGTCATPADRKAKKLSDVIKENNPNAPRKFFMKGRRKEAGTKWNSSLP